MTHPRMKHPRIEDWIKLVLENTDKRALTVTHCRDVASKFHEMSLSQKNAESAGEWQR